MANENLFLRRAEGGYNFACNRENGKWVLTKKSNLEEIEEIISGTSLEKPDYSGTSMVVINVGRSCNLDCVYCHIGNEKRRENMSLEVGRRSIDRVLELPKKDRGIIFHGSEPLLNYTLIMELIKYSREKGLTKFGVQTNGTLFTEEILDFFKKNNVGVGISLDGLERHHGKTRPYLGGNSSYWKVIENLSKVREFLGGVSVISVVSSYNVEELEEIVEDFQDRGINSVRFLPLYPNSTNHEFAPEPKLLAYSMKAVFDSYLKRILGEEDAMNIKNFQEFMKTIFRNKITSNCAKCGGGERQPLIGIDIDGSIYPCDFFWGRGKYALGNIEENSLRESLNSGRNFRTYRNVDSLEDCVSCDWKIFCGSGCPGSSVLAGKGIASKDYYCEYTKEMLDYVVSKILILHEHGFLKKVLRS